MTQLSRRAYAARSGVSDRAIRKHIASGVLAPAVLPNGLLDAELADQLLERNLTKPKNGAPLVLATAKQRRARAVVQDLLDQVRELRRSLIAPDLAETRANEATASAWRIAREWPARIAPTVAGKPAEEVQRLLKVGVNDLLGAFYDEGLQEEKDNAARRAAAPRRPKIDLAALTAVELQALAENLRAEILERERLERIGKTVRVEDAIALYEEALAVSKSLLNAIPGRTATLIEFADVAETERLLAVEIEGFCEAGRLDVSPLLRNKESSE